MDEDILTCLNAETGERRWKDGHYGFGQLLLADSHLVISTGDGELALVRAIPDRWEELARFPAIQGKTWNHPCLAQGKLLVRNAVDHGIEPPKVRHARGKNACGMLKLTAFHKAGNILIQLSDDGAGFNRQRILAKARARRFSSHA